MIGARNATFYLAGRLVSCLTVATALVSALGASGAPGAEDSLRRSLRLPADRTVGKVYWRLPDGKPFLYAINDRGWRPVDNTRKTVRLPAEAQVRLDVAKGASGDLAWLDDVLPDDIQLLDLRGTDVSDEGLRHVARLTGLRAIDVRGVPISDAGLHCLEALTNLEQIDLGTLGGDGKGYAVGAGALRALARLPKLRRLGLWRIEATEAALGELVNCRSLTHLELTGTKLSDAGLAELARCRSLTYLRLDDTNVSDAGLVRLAKLPQLESLWLGDNAGVSDEGLKTVGKLVNLTWLDLMSTKITGAGLARLKELKKLKTLLLDHTGVGEADLAYLEPLENLETIRLYDIKDRVTDVAAEHLARLKSLREVSGNLYFTDRGVALLATLPHLEQLLLDGPVTDASAGDIAKMESLKKLWFQECPITNAMLLTIAGLPNLENLLLSRTRVTGDGFEHLRGAPRLSTLWVNFDRTGDKKPADQSRPHLREIGKLIQIKNLRIDRGSLVSGDLNDLTGLVNLEWLDIPAISVDDEGASALAALKHLKWLQISEGELTDVGLERLSLLPRLEFVGLAGRFTDEGLMHLAQLGQLQRLWLSSADITDAGLQELARRLPNLRHGAQRRTTANRR